MDVNCICFFSLFHFPLNFTSWNTRILGENKSAGLIFLIIHFYYIDITRNFFGGIEWYKIDQAEY